MAGWLNGWAKRVKLTIDNTDITAALSNFPVLIYLSTSSGRGPDDVSFVFDEVGANSLKIAVTEGDGTTECYVEVEKWDNGGEEAWLWAKVPAIASDADTDIYLYYDNDHADNTDRVGATNSVAAENVWDADFVFVSHMADDPDTSHVRDSTSNDNDGAKGDPGEPVVTTAGLIGNAQDFEVVDDEITVAGLSGAPDAFSVEFSINPDTVGEWYPTVQSAGTPNWDRFAFHSEPAGGIYVGTDSGTRFTPTDLPGGTVVTGSWQRFTYTYDGTQGRFYKNGALLAGPKNQNAPLAWGGFRLGEPLTWGGIDGKVDEVRVSDIERPVAWLFASYESERDDLLDFGSEEFGHVLTETLSLGDVLSFSGSIDMTISETLSAFDNILKGMTKAPFIETVSLTDTILKGTQKVLTETLDIVTNTTLDIILTLPKPGESISLTDNILRQLAAYRILTETATLSDTFLRTLALQRIFAETITASDIGIDIIQDFVAILTETLTLTDTLIETLIPGYEEFSKILTETLALSDTVLRQLAIYRILAETSTLTDIILKGPQKVLAETITSSDTLLRILALQRFFTETTILNDALLRTLALQRILSEAVTLDDTVTTIKVIIKILTETLALSDTFLRTLTLHRILTETLALSDIFLRQLVLYRNLIENIIASDTLTRRLSLYRILWERPSGENWLSGWDKRVKTTLDHNDIDAAVSDFPHLVYLSASSGHSSKDVSCVFDELGNDANRKKIAVTKADGTTECYVEIEQWDDANEQAWLWVKVPAIDPDVDTELYLYYDSSKADNDAYVGDPNSVPAENVWDSDFKFVSHMLDDPDADHIRDSTSNDNDATKQVPDSTEVDGKIARAQEFATTDIEAPDDDSLDFGEGDFTVEAWMYIPSTMITNNAGLRKKAGNGANVVGYGWFMNDGFGAGKMYFTYSAGAGRAIQVLSVAIHDDSWHKIVGVRDTVGGKLRLYLDGVPDNTANDVVGSVSNDQQLEIGMGQARLIGKMDEPRLSSCARTPAWIKADYESERDHLNDFGEEETEEAVPGGIGLSDTLTWQMNLYRTLAESVTPADTLTRQMDLYRILSETVATDDAMTRLVKFYKILSDTATLDDTLVRQMDLFRIFAETASLTDSIIKGMTKAPFAESTTLVDSIIKGIAKAPFTESISLTDLISKGVSTTFTETVAATDTLTRIATFFMIFPETMTATDTLTKQFQIVKVLTETILLWDLIHGAGKDIVATVELSLYTKKMVLTVFEKKNELNLHMKKGILDVFKKTHDLALPVKRIILKRRV